MSRYIDADKIPWTDLNDNQNSNIKVLVTFAEKVNRMPTADVRENVRGEWVGGELGECSICGHKGCASDIWTGCNEKYYCPNCGAELVVE